MAIFCQKNERTLTIAIRGDVDHHAAASLMRELTHEIERELPLTVILNCHGITFMDSSGIAVLLRVLRRMEALHGQLYCEHVPPQARKVLEAAGVHRLISLDGKEPSHESAAK